VIWRGFRKALGRTAPTAAWWELAARAADAPTAALIAQLRSGVLDESPLDEREQQDEMIDGLDQLLPLTQAERLPVVDTQHRVIGDDRCHFVTPATLAAEVAVPGKLFLTDRRLVFAGGRAQTWAWHGVRRVARADRTVDVVTSGDLVRLQCNSFGDALVVRYLARRLAGHDAAGSVKP
jgi:hypothetical protein